MIVVAGALGAFLVLFLVWVVVMGWLDDRRTQREERAMRDRWRGVS